MAMGAAAAVVVVLLVLYFSLGGSSAGAGRIVLTRVIYGNGTEYGAAPLAPTAGASRRGGA